MSIVYNFFCIICGNPMKVGKNHARTCSTSCRIALSNIMRQGADGNEDISNEDQKIAIKKEAKVTGKYVTEDGKIKKPFWRGKLA
mgnify:CR=1 FL=1